MPHGSSARRNWLRTIILGSALAAGAGCAGKDKTDTGLRSLDPRAKAALTTPEGPKPLVTPKVAVGDPNATGLTNLTAKESFNRTRPFLPAGTSTGSASLTQPGAGVPITPELSVGRRNWASPVVVARKCTKPSLSPYTTLGPTASAPLRPR